MIISQCPRCHEGFRIPSGSIPADAYAHCPWCRETFPIAEVLGSLPPALGIVTADGKPVALDEPTTGFGTGLQLVESTHRQPGAGSGGSLPQHQSDDSFGRFDVQDEHDSHSTIANETVADTLVDEDWHRNVSLVDADHVSSADTDDDDPYSTWDGSKSSPIESMNVATKGGTRKRKGAGIGTFLGIVLGGLASVPIAGGLLALMGRTPDWGFWPFQGEQVSSSVRATPLPASDARMNPTSRPTGTPLRFDRGQADLEPSVDPAVSAAQQIINSDRSETSGDPASTEAMQVSDTADAIGTEQFSTAQADYSAVAASDEPDQPRRMEIGDQEAPEVQEMERPSDDRSVALEQGDQRSDTERSDTERPVAASVSPSTVSTSDTNSMADTDELVSRVSQMIAAMSNDQVDQRERRRRIGITYQKIASIAGLVEEPAEPLESLAGEIVASPLLEDFRLAGWEWLVYKDRQSDGIALIGRASVTNEGEFLTGNSGETISLVSGVEIPDGREVLVLGRLINQGSSLRVVHAEPIP